MKKQQRVVLVLLAGATLIANQVGCKPKPDNAQTTINKVEQKLRLKGYYRSIPWKQVGGRSATRMSIAGRAIPFASYSLTASRDGHNYQGTLVGTSPFSKTLKGSTINAVVVPLKITVGSVTFDPSAPDPCNGNVSALTRFRQSPLANDVPNLTIKGVNLGDVQFINGLRRAEFWSTIQGSPAYQNELRYFYVNPYELTADAVGPTGTTDGTGCGQIGVLNSVWFDKVLRSQIPLVLSTSGVTSPTVVLFLVKNVVESDATPPLVATDCCALGYHGAFGTSIQTYGVIDWDTSNRFENVSDASIASHEIGEWMDDPLGTNATPPWGDVGQVVAPVSPCQNNLEVGDPLSGKLMPTITTNGMAYQMQELAFFSWFFNNETDPSVGAGSSFSSNGSFKGPAKSCPPGGSN